MYISMSICSFTLLSATKEHAAQNMSETYVVRVTPASDCAEIQYQRMGWDGTGA